MLVIDDKNDVIGNYFSLAVGAACFHHLNQQLVNLQQLLLQRGATAASSSAPQPAQGEFYVLIRVFAVFPYVCVFIIFIVLFDTCVSPKLLACLVCAKC